MLNIHNLSVSFGGTYLFEEVTFRLGSGDRVGLVGKNGAGKSTMLKILAKDLVAENLAVIVTEAEEVTLNNDTNGDGSLRWNTSTQIDTVHCS